MVRYVLFFGTVIAEPEYGFARVYMAFISLLFRRTVGGDHGTAVAQRFVIPFSNGQNSAYFVIADQLTHVSLSFVHKLTHAVL